MLIMPDGYFGGVVLCHGISYQSRAIRLFTRSPFAHCGLRISETEFESMEWPNKILKYSLENPPEQYLEYIIQEPIEISASQRLALQILNEQIPKDYDVSLILRLAKRHLLKKKPDLTDISKKDVYACSYRHALLFEMIGIEVIQGVHPSQIEPQHFLESKNFRTIRKWKRD